MTTRIPYETLALPPLPKPNMAFTKHTLGLDVKPAIKTITANTVDLFLLKVQEGFTLSAAAKSLSLSHAQLREILQKRVSEASLKESMRIGAEVIIAEASDALKYASDKEEIDRAKALAQHYRWLAAKLNAKMYGDSIKVDGNAAPSYELIVNISPPALPQPTEKTVTNANANGNVNGRTNYVLEHAV